MEITRKQGIQCVICLLLFSFIIRLCLGVLYENEFDLAWYRTWALELQNGFFDAYARMSDGKYALDYPPIYLIFLFLVGKGYSLFPLTEYAMYDMFAMKFFPILFDVLAGYMLYLCCRRHNEMLGVLAASLWALNPVAIFNSAAWGQTDGMMICLLVLAFYVIETDRPLLGSILFAVAALTKMQALYFTPVLFLILFKRYQWRTTLYSAGAALATGITAFVPFIIGSFSSRGAAALLTPFEVYFGGLGKYPYAALNTYNLYGTLSLNWVKDDTPILGFFTYNMLSSLLMIASLALLVYWLLRERTPYGLWAGCFLFMQCVFMLTTRMHERYQMVVLPFALVLFIRSRNVRWLWIFCSISCIAFANQFMLLIRNNTVNDPAAPWAGIFNPVQIVFSILNLLVFAWSIYETWRLLFPKENAEETMTDEKSIA